MFYFSARIAEVESRVENTANSFNDICDQLEGGTGASAIHCCVNGLNNKIRCEQKAFLELPTIKPVLNIDTSVDGVCDRRAVTGTSNACSDNPPSGWWKYLNSYVFDYIFTNQEFLNSYKFVVVGWFC